MTPAETIASVELALQALNIGIRTSIPIGPGLRLGYSCRRPPRDLRPKRWHVKKAQSSRIWELYVEAYGLQAPLRETTSEIQALAVQALPDLLDELRLQADACTRALRRGAQTVREMAVGLDVPGISDANTR
jgi:hypothetical protein